MTRAQEARIIVTRLTILGAIVALACQPDWRQVLWNHGAPLVQHAWSLTPWGRARREFVHFPLAPRTEDAARVAGSDPVESTPAERPASGDPEAVGPDPLPDTGPDTGQDASTADAEATDGAGSPAASPVEPEEWRGNLPLQLSAAAAPRPLPASLRDLKAAADRSPNAFRLRKLADAAAATGFAALAAEAYSKEAAIYRKEGDINAATVEELKAGRYRAEARLFFHDPDASPPSTPRARLEPEYDVLLGAFIDRDERLREVFQDENSQTHRDPEEFAALVGKKHASLFCYLSYGRPFPLRWAQRLHRAGVIPHLAWEPRNLSQVQEDGFLHTFADSVANCGGPVFLRFAGEMNGAWTPYHGNPALYREKFRLVSRVIRRRAPNAAMIWCVNNFPDSEIEKYYPGDEYVDWVGVNFYNVLYSDNDRARPADHLHPADLFQTVYRRYAARKPIAICEYAASHQAAVDPRPRPQYAARRLSELYASLPRLFPHVKLVDWFNCNNLLHARPDRQLNNYSITDDPQILKAFRRAIAPDYFLGSAEERPGAVIRPFQPGEPVQGTVTFSAWVRAPVPRPRVYLLADSEVLYAGDEPGPAVARWDSTRAKPGKHTLRLVVLDAENRRLADVRQEVLVQN